MLDYQVLKEVLELPEFWEVVGIEVDKPSNRIDFTLSYGKPKKSIFGRKKDEGDIVVIKHLPTLGMRTFLNIPEAALTEHPLFGANANSKMTSSLEQWIKASLESARSYQSVSKITGVTVAEARELAERTGAGIQEIDNFETPQEQVTTSSFDMSSTIDDIQSFNIESSDNVPIETHDNWQLLINGDIPVHSNAVGLKMLLQKVRQEVNENPSEITRLNAAKTLRQYFIKNQKTHQEEINLIAGDEATNNVQAIREEVLTPSSTSISSNIPEENHAAWAGLLDGTLQLSTKNVGLQMMLERLRLSIMQTSGPQAETNAKKILRQFFQKHSARLSNEMAQLGFNATAPVSQMASSSSANVPNESDNCWKQLIDNQFTINTSQVGLQMMLERVRMTLARNPSDSNYMASIKILRQYFLKHKVSHASELQQLIVHSSEPVADMVPSSNESNIPLETDLIWQRLIDGDIQIQTDAVAFNMMLERVRVSIHNNPAESNRLAGVKLLRQYFIKHKQTHKAELQQLIAA